MAYRELAPNQRAQIWIRGPEVTHPELLFETDDVLIEAPNWSSDGASLYLNGHGSLWRLDLTAPKSGLVSIEFEKLPELNNDHMLDPGGEQIYMSAMDGHIYRGALGGGAVDRVSRTTATGIFSTACPRTDPAWPISNFAASPIREGWP